MLRDPKVIEHLNTQLTNELTAINQYFLHARTLQHWGVTKLGKYEYEESIDEMRHADELIKRGAIEFPSPYWDGVSDGAKDLVRRCLVVVAVVTCCFEMAGN